MRMHQGYLVVVERSEDLAGDSLNKVYKGMDRIPAYPSKYVEEAEALDEYLFGEFKNEIGFIPTLEKARQLLELFSPSSRKFEIIYCEQEPAAIAPLAGAGVKSLGFDVAGVGGDCWSIVADFPDNLKMRPFLKFLNQHGLFEDQKIAHNYLSEYRALKLHDFDLPLAIFNVTACH